MDDRGTGGITQDVSMDALASKMQGKMVVSIDVLDQEEAGKTLKFAILLRRSLGRSVQKNPMEDLLTKIWKLKQAETFWKVDKDIRLVNFASEEDQLNVLNGAPGLLKGVLL